MDISLIADTVTMATQQGLGYASILLRHQNLITVADSSPSVAVQISAAILDAIAPPPLKSTSFAVGRRTLLRKKRRTRRTHQGGDSEDGDNEEFWFFGGDGDGDGTFGGGFGSWGSGGGGGGGGWSFDGHSWDEPSWSPSLNFAYGFVYEVF
ncbi:hypothetical protein K2173_022543 [Erythroxylum novogranatense]|uniref:Uncharacterized protein n=1 Tax=Erythroxylum novogranatense TaxID=1862640 RepID=A0AAV8TKK1_9ROSI|nr:hypothetical protein K2173_022543 [Erythroxylum novogranatense]